MLRWMESIPNDGLIRYLEIFNTEVVAVTTPRGAAEFLQARADQYARNTRNRAILEKVMGTGLVVAEGMDHKVLAPTFIVARSNQSSINGNISCRLSIPE